MVRQIRPQPTALSVLVVRSGGFAGLKQQWQVEPDGDRDDWIALIGACPWDAVPSDPTSRDAFTWRIEARMPPSTRTASVPDRELVGPWRDLVDRVQQAAHG
jgi:hypothetical protein